MACFRGSVILQEARNSELAAMVGLVRAIHPSLAEGPKGYVRLPVRAGISFNFNTYCKGDSRGVEWFVLSSSIC